LDGRTCHRWKVPEHHEGDGNVFQPAASEPRSAPLFCLVLLTGSCALASFVFACATPFAAFAVVASCLLPLIPALLVTAGAWIVNQAIGFGVLGYPLDLNTVSWGFVIGAAALLATAESKLLLHSQRSSSPAALGVALLGAYAAYEVVLFASGLVLAEAGRLSSQSLSALESSICFG
jgi:hypothetical protein